MVFIHRTEIYEKFSIDIFFPSSFDSLEQLKIKDTFRSLVVKIFHQVTHAFIGAAHKGEDLVDEIRLGVLFQVKIDWVFLFFFNDFRLIFIVIFSFIFFFLGAFLFFIVLNFWLSHFKKSLFLVLLNLNFIGLNCVNFLS